jgi:RND family efflux transporter MFP subunit
MNWMDVAAGLKKTWKLLVGVAGLALMILYSGGACHAKVGPGRAAYEPGEPLPAGAEIIAVGAEPVASRIDVVGTITSEEQIHLSARISAYVREVSVSAGSGVRSGQTLVTLDDRELQEQLAAAQAQLKQAESEYERARQLIRTRATTEQAFTAAESSYTAAKAQVDRMRVLLSYATITSPIAGIVTDRRIEAGDLANAGEVLLTVYDPTRMRLEAPVPLRLVDRLSIGQALEVRLDRPARAFAGRLAQIVSEADPMTRTQTVKIQLEGATSDVLPGSFGRFFVEQAPRDALLVPAAAVRRVGQIETVPVARGGRVLRRLVKTGPL